MLGLGWWIAGGITTVVGGSFLILWFRFYRILRVSEALGKDDMPQAKEYLSKIKNPEKLNDYSKTYYNFFQGIIDTKENRFKEAEAEFKTALSINRFRSPDEKATAHLMVGQLLLRKRNRQGAIRHMREAKSLTSNEQILAQIKELAKQARIRL
jgi:tetratricopeptide (TPR) repeat protein